MKKFICLAAAVMMLLGCAAAEEAATEIWQHEAGWINFSVAITQEGADEVWEQAAKIFGESVGIPMTGDMLKSGVLQGHTLENDVEILGVEGNRITGKKADGTELFSHEYSLAEVMEEEGIMDGKKVYVFRTEEAGAGKYTYLLMTEPVRAENETAGYTTFNLVCTENGNYRDLFDTEKAETAVQICAMINHDAGVEGLAYAVQKMFASPVVISK